jgi:hypothetical protein
MEGAPDQTLWLVCAIFYLADNVRMHDPKTLFVGETWNRQWRILFPLHCFRLRGRSVTLLSPLLPSALVVGLDWLRDGAFDPAALKRATRTVKVRQRQMAPLRLLAGIGFVNIFVAGPIVTHIFGVGYALILQMLPTHLLALAALAIVPAAERRLWRMSWLQVVGVVLECAVCPAYLVNICRRMAIRFGVTGDAIVFVHSAASSEERLAIGPRLDLLADDLTENGELSERDFGMIKAYQALLAVTPT